MKNNPESLILFCGLPATLKTYISVRLSGRLGFAYIPTRALGKLVNCSTPKTLYNSRIARYSDLVNVVLSALSFGANVIVDGGFPTSESRSMLLDKTDPNKVIIIHCVCDKSTRIKRLEKRANDNFDYENQNSKDILQNLRINNDLIQEESPELDLNMGKVNSILVVDSTNMSLKWKGCPPEDLSNKINQIIKELLEDFKLHEINSKEKEIIEHFNDFAGEYDNTTEWRKNNEILKSLQTSSIPNPSRVLDIGAGTGLASEWYTEQGHFVTGIDISPKMLQKASKRLNFVLLGSGTNLPFINNYFNLIIIRQCLHYVDPKQLLSEAYRVLKKGGLIIVSSAVCPNEETKMFWKEFKNATQPLRLDVFTSEDIKVLINNTGCKFIEEIHCSISRIEKVDSIEKRSRNISGGFHLFLSNMEKITSKLFPDLKFHIKNNHLMYRQFWVTISAEK